MSNPNPTNSQQIIAVDKILLAYKNMPTVLIANLLCCLPLFFTAWDTGIRTTAIIWLAIHFGLITVRILHHFSFNPASASVDSILRYGKINLVLIALTGAIWGLTGWIFFDPDAITVYSFLILTLLCVNSGSMSAVSSIPPAYVIFSSLAMGPIIFITLTQGTSFYNLMGLGALVYLIMTIIFTRNLNQSIHSSLVLKYENLGLVENLKVQTEAAQKANLDKSRFLAAASHDVRQPLHAINLFTHALEHQLDHPDQKSSLAGVQRGLDSLGELFDALLDVSRIDSHITPINKTHFKLDTLISDVISMFESDALNKSIELIHYDCQHPVHTDKALLEQILTNIIGNAIRYTQQGNVQVFCDQLNNDTLILHIKDTGIGIDKADLDSIFQEFTQLNNPERNRNKGLGLGLAITRRLTTLLQLQLNVQSQLNVGSDFCIKIPLSHQQLPETAAQPSSDIGKQLAGLKVLVVDNEKEIVAGIKLLLENWQCQVWTATSTDSALQVSGSGLQPDLIISDYRMPGKLNGLELIHSIRQQHPKIASMIITGDTSPNVSLKAQQHGLMLLRKPVKLVQLYEAITRLVSNRVNNNPRIL